MKSLRGRLLLGSTLTCAGVFILLGLALDLLARHALLTAFDDTLRAQGAAIASMVEWHGRRTVFDENAGTLSEFAPGEHSEFFQVWVDGKPLARSPSLGGSQLAPSPSGSGVRWSTLPDGRRGRILTLTFHPVLQERPDPERRAPAATAPAPPTASLAVGRDSEELDRTLARLRWAMLGLSAGGLVLLAGVLGLVIHRGTASVGRLSRAIGAVDANHPAARLEAAGLPAELTPVVERLNELLARLADALERERAFTADVAHELRTPLAGIRATLEVCRTRPRDPAAYETAIDRTMGMIVQMQSLVQNMLMLARAEGGELAHDAAAVDLAETLRSAWRLVEEAARARRLQAHWSVTDGLAARADEELLRMVAGNLLENAAAYAPPGSDIHISAAAEGDAVCLSVTNDAPGITEHDIDHLFDRFWRKDRSRAEAGLHAGLGLSLCRRLVQLMDGTIGASTAHGRLTLWLRLARVRLSAAAAATAEPQRGLAR